MNRNAFAFVTVSLLAGVSIGGDWTLADGGSNVFGVEKPAPAREQQPADSVDLVAALGCGACHGGLPESDVIRGRAPSLAYAGLRYQTSFLFAYLQNPARVRLHIGRSRMPSFHLDERERLALALYLETLSTIPDEASVRLLRSWDGSAPPSAPDEGRTLVRGELGCVTCHSIDGEGASRAIELAEVGSRLKTDWVRRYLAVPYAFDPRTTMPALFYYRRGGQAQLADLVVDAERKLRVVTLYLATRDEARRLEQERGLETARARYPDVTAEMGAAVFRALNCAGCHEHTTEAGQEVAPDLSNVGDRLRPEWLRQYLARPVAVRPFGFHPGAGSRMPDYVLDSTEVDSVAAQLEGPRPRADVPSPDTLTTFLKAKAAGFLQRKYSCLGCHRLDEEGGRIAPDLSLTGARLRPAYVHAIIRDPQEEIPGTVMPKRIMQEDRYELIASYLASRPQQSGAEAPGRERRGYASLLDYESERYGSESPTGAGLYSRYCATCHGPDGRGDGFNAPFLPATPTQHADSEHMSPRPDDTLFDGIHAGGLILGRSHRMPAFGQILSYQQIRSLVRYMRALCECEGPSWSRDDSPRRP
jgi:mono/diheme cytochrome c family protein